MTVRIPSITNNSNYSDNYVTRTVTRAAVLNVVKEVFPDAYISGNQIVIPTLTSDHKDGDMYALRILTTPSYKE